MERNYESQKPLTDEARDILLHRQENFEKNNTVKGSSAYAAQNNTFREFQTRPERTERVNMNQNNQQFFQQQQHNIMPQNYQQGVRLPQVNNQIRPPINNNSLNNYMPQRPPIPTTRNTEMSDIQRNTAFSNSQQFNNEQQQRFISPSPMTRPPVAERTNLLRQASNQNFYNLRPQSQPVELQKNQVPHGQLNNQQEIESFYLNGKTEEQAAKTKIIDRVQESHDYNSQFLIKKNSDSTLESNSAMSNYESIRNVPEKPEQSTSNRMTTLEKEKEQANEKSEVEPEISSVQEKKSDNSVTVSKCSKTLIEYETLKSGIVLKNIKYFEEQDTAKIPLAPKTIFTLKQEKNKMLLNIMNESTENGDGVDETPMYHPNLRSIYETPSKVAKIPFSKKRKDKIKKPGVMLSPPNRNKIVKFTYYADDKRKLTKDVSYPAQKTCKKRTKVQFFKPEEELLAFFHNSKLMRKFGESKKKDEQDRVKNNVGSKPTTNGHIASPKRVESKSQGSGQKSPLTLPTGTPLKSPGTPKAKSLPKTPETPAPQTPLIKKVPMNKVQVGAAPSPNLKAARSKVGSLANSLHKPGGGNVRIENHKIDFSKAQSRIEAKNDQYVRSGGDKKIPQVKLQWEAKSKVGSLENATYKPGGGDKKIESVKLDFKEKAKSKVGSKDNLKHTPGGGTVKIESQKLEFKAQSKVGSLDNVKHKPGGGDVKIFDDKTYLKQVSMTSDGGISGSQTFGNFSVLRESGGRSAPGTPGPKTVVKVKKTTSITSARSTPALQNGTKTAFPKSPSKARNIEKMQEKKLCVPPTSSAKNGILTLDSSPVKVGKASRLMSNLSAIEASENCINENINARNSSNINKSDSQSHNQKKNLQNVSNHESPGLPEGKSFSRIDLDSMRVLKNEKTFDEKAGESRNERISTNENKVYLSEQQKSNFSISSYNNQTDHPNQTTYQHDPESRNRTDKMMNEKLMISSDSQLQFTNNVQNSF